MAVDYQDVLMDFIEVLTETANVYPPEVLATVEAQILKTTDWSTMMIMREEQKKEATMMKVNILKRLLYPTVKLRYPNLQNVEVQPIVLGGIVIDVVDGDTLDVNNLPVRLAMVNTPEVGEGGYDEAKEFTESECSVGSEALVDEDDGQKAGSYGRLIGIVHCNGNSSSLNELLLETDNAVLYEDFCDVSEFASDDWVTKYGCDG
jgi:endonuclease YncB( thermonuclease family)